LSPKKCLKNNNQSEFNSPSLPTGIAYFLASQKVGRRRQKIKIRDQGIGIRDQDLVVRGNKLKEERIKTREKSVGARLAAQPIR